MNDRRKRPLGITLLAVLFLWTGCIGTLFFPIVLLTGSVSQMTDVLRSERIQSENLRLALACLLSVIWLGAYIVYVLIGFGLWRLRKWAWRAVVVVQWISFAMCAAAGVVIAKILVKQPFLGIPLSVGLMAPIAGILWYLYQSSVRATFEIELPGKTISAVVVLPSTPKKSGPLWLKVIIIVVVSVALFGGSLMFIVESMFRSSTIYATTLNDAQQAPCVIAKLGTPIQAKGMISGNMSESTTDGSADLAIPIHGPKGNAELQVSAKKSEGTWTITSLVLDQKGDQTQLLPPGGATDCH